MISRSKVEHIVCLALNGINIVFYLLIITAVIFKCIQGNFADIVMGIYGIVIAAFYFLSTYRGRGLVMIFFGCLVLDTGIVNIVVGTLVLATGLLYVIMSFLSHFPQPNPITINWRNWNDFSAEGLDLPHPRNMNNNVVSEMHERLKSPAPVLSNQHQLPLNEMIHPQQPPKRRH